MDGIHRYFWLAMATLPSTALAQFRGGFGPNNNPNNPSSASSPFPGFNNGGGFEDTLQQRAVHGVLASLAFVILMPAGAVAMTALRGRAAFWTHASVQAVAWVFYVISAALGFLLVRDMRVPGGNGVGDLISDPRTNYHPILGVVLLLLVAVQPLLGYLHHRRFQARGGGRTLVSYAHVWNGRVLIVLGIVNGGLGLQISRTPDGATLGYTIVAAVFGGVWVAVTVLGEVRRRRARRDVFGEDWRVVRMGRDGQVIKEGDE